MLIDLRSKGLTGALVCDALARAHIVCNKNAVPNDPQKPSVTSGLRIGTPAGTTRGFGVAEFSQIADMIADVIEACGKGEDILERTIKEVQEKAGDVIEMPVGTKHTIFAETELKLIEVQIGESINVQDKIKYELN